MRLDTRDETCQLSEAYIAIARGNTGHLIAYFSVLYHVIFLKVLNNMQVHMS